MQVKPPKTMLPNGLATYGATPNTARLYQLILDYFDHDVEFSPGMTVVDVGANIGLFSLEVLRRCGGDVRLIAVEPGPVACDCLERNIREHFPDSKAKILRCAVSDRSGEAVFYVRPLASALSSLDPGPLTDRRPLIESLLRPNPPAAFRSITPGWLKRLPRPIASQALDWLIRRSESKVEPTTCTLKTLSEIMADHSIDRIDFLKIDVEGAEMKVLGGVAPADWPRIQAISLEVHDIDGRVEEVRSLLGDVGFSEIEVGQEWLFESSNVYMVFAGRGRAAWSRNHSSERLGDGGSGE